LFWVVTSTCVQAQQLLCDIFDSGEDHPFVFSPTDSPYTVKPIDLNRFRFKAVLTAGVLSLDHIKITVSYRSSGQALILQQATYLPPFAKNQSLTGRQQIYSPDLGRELSYDCTVVDSP
jgi:hypothetical protein